VPSLLQFARPSSSHLLEDEMRVLLLRSLVSGEPVGANINALARKQGKHQNTIRKEVLQLLGHGVVNPAVSPFMGLTMLRRRLKIMLGSASSF